MYNILIVDDEQICRDGVAKMINGLNDHCCVFTAKNGIEALGIIQNQRIHGMMLDVKMPHMDGLQLLEKLRELKIDDIATVILSGHDEFEYAKKAMSFGTFDYILKPVDDKEVVEIYLKMRLKLDAQDKKEKEMVKLKKQIAESKPIIKERLFFDILRGKIDIDAFRDKAEFLNLDISSDCYRVALLELETKTAGVKQTEEDYQAQVISLENFLEGQLKTKYGFNLFHLNTDVFVLLFCLAGLSGEGLRREEAAIAEMRTEILAETGLEVTVGIGNGYQGVENIKKSYYQAQNALRYKVLMGKGGIYSIQDFEQVSNDFIFNFDTERLNMLIKTNQKEPIIAEMKETFAKLGSATPKTDIHMLYLLCNKYLTSLFGVLAESSIGIMTFFEGNNNPFSEMVFKKSINEIQEWLTAIIEEVLQKLNACRKEKDIRIVSSIKQFLNSRFKEEIGNKLLAEQFGYSINYIGQIFKNEAGLTISEYLKMIRLSHAKKLLKETPLKINEVARESGFDDQQYFCAVFKKAMGVTPSEYREL